MSFIVGKKLNMSQYFAENGDVFPVTVLQANPVVVTQVKTRDGKDKYNAVQVGVSAKIAGKRKLNKPLTTTLGTNKVTKAIEFRLTETNGFEVGKNIDVSGFQIGEMVNVVSTMKGRGFAGAMKRHGFAGFPASHGHDRPRSVGSIGQRFPQHVRKGLRMAGHMGASQVTVKNLQVVSVDASRHLLTLKGAVPGHRNSVVKIVGTGKVKPLFRVEAVKEEKKKK